MKSTMIATLGVAATAATLALTAGSASAATILFQDTFERAANDTVGNGWSEVERDASDVRIVQNGTDTNGRLVLRDRVDRTDAIQDVDAGAASSTIDATGFENLSVTFRWRARGNNQTDDTLNLSFSELATPTLATLSDWTTVFSTDSSTVQTNTTETISLTGLSDTSFSLFFSTDVAGNNQSGFNIFEVSVSGDAIAVVPLPAGMPLMLLGLGALGVTRRRKSKG